MSEFVVLTLNDLQIGVAFESGIEIVILTNVIVFFYLIERILEKDVFFWFCRY